MTHRQGSASFPPAFPRRLVLALGSAAALLRPGLAAETWPAGPLRMVIPFPAGSTPDLVARVVAEHLAAAFGRPCVPDNRPGAGGTIGTDLVAKAQDGLTIGVTINGPIATAQALYPNLPYDPARDLALVSLLVQAPQILVVHPAVPATDLAGFIAHAKANPGRMSFASVGPGSASHLAMEELKAKAGVDLVHVPYKGFPEATLDLVAGRIEAMFVTAGGILPQIEAGKVKPLVVTAATRLPQAPDIPTVVEAGLPDLVGYAWIGLIASASTPPERVQRLADAARAALTAPDRRALLEQAGFEIVASSPAEFRGFAAVETTRWGGLARRLGIRLGN